MRPLILLAILTVSSLVLTQSAFAYDKSARRQINQIERQLQQQFPQQQQFSQGMPQQDPEAQQQIQMIEQELQQFSPQQSLQQPSQPGFQQPSMYADSGQMQSPTVVPMAQQANFAQQRQNFAPSFNQAQQLPMLNASMNGFNSRGGVDILDESMQYHNQTPGQNAMQNGMMQPMCGANNVCNGQHNTCAHSQFNPSVCPHNTCQHATACGGHSHDYCNHTQGSGGAGDSQMTTRAIGAIGAAALMGHFINNGGVGGMMKSVGLDNTRHIRGASIGGY